jgi:hypothetical protein
MSFLANPFIIPLGAFLMVVCIVTITVGHRNHAKELDHDLRLREMEHEKRMKEMDLEMARLNSKSTKGIDDVNA